MLTSSDLTWSGVALAPNGKDLYVGYLKSGDIMKVADAMQTASGSPSVARVASTSDGRGVNSLAMLKGKLYVGELGGVGVSAIDDISGVNETPGSYLMGGSLDLATLACHLPNRRD